MVPGGVSSRAEVAGKRLVKSTFVTGQMMVRKQPLFRERFAAKLTVKVVVVVVDKVALEHVARQRLVVTSLMPVQQNLAPELFSAQAAANVLRCLVPPQFAPLEKFCIAKAANEPLDLGPNTIKLFLP